MDDFKGYVFNVSGAHKDMRYITEMKRQLGLSTLLNDAVLAVFERADADGLGELFVSELLRADIRERRGGI